MRDTEQLWDTGERVAPEPHNTLYLEHLSAYEVARGLVRTGTILDIGCGAGHGSNHLASDGKQVMGLDYNGAVATAATRRFRRPGVSFACMDAMHLGVQKASADFVCAFQVIEHLRDQEGFVRELARVLRPSGLALISTPNALISLGPKNPFHVHEFTPDELRQLLGKYFPYVKLAGQRRPEAIYALEAACQKVRRWDVFGMKGLMPRGLVSLIVYLIARLKRLTPPQRMPLQSFPISPQTDNAYNLFALCGQAPLPDDGLAFGVRP